ncbi:MAG TPA: hypothetical protein VFG62_08745 [Rhodopila sp.]|jgi:hypothetical protein|nr:hypothetical protein [Rhodopila sp.]
MAVDWSTLVIEPCLAAFGMPVTYTPLIPTLDTSGKPTFNADGTPAGTFGTAYAAEGVFDDAYVEVTPGGGGPFPSTDSMEFGAVGGITEARPVLGVQLSAMQTQPNQGDKIAINGVNYTVKEPQPDGHGWALLILNIAP